MKHLLFALVILSTMARGGIVPIRGSTSGGGGAPSGPAGGVLAGTYPNPSLAVDRVRVTGDTMSGPLSLTSVTASGAVQGATVNVTGLTASRATVTDGSKNLASSATTATEIGFVNGVTGAIQTQLAGKEPTQTKGSISTSTTGLTVGSGANSTVGPNVTVNASTAAAGVTGLLTGTDWSTFNSKGSGTVTAVSVASANGLAGSSSGGATPALTLSTSVTGILSGNGTAISAASTTGSGAVVLATSPTLVTPALGTPSALVGTNITGTAAGLTAGNVTTNANLTGPITSSGNATSIASQTGTGTTFAMSAAPSFTGTVTSAGQIQAVSGAVGSPGYSFSADPTTGFLLNSAGTIGFATNGVQQLTLTGGSFGSALPIRLSDGSVGTPSLGFVNNTTTGIYRAGTNILGFSSAGAASGQITAAGNWQIGTATPISFTAEKMSLANADSSGGSSAYSTLATQISLTSNTAYTAATSLPSAWNRLQRTMTTSTTDTAAMGAQQEVVRFNITSGQTLTNSSTDGVFGLMIDAATNQAAGTLALANYSGLYVKADSLATGTDKHGLRIGNISGGTNNYAIKTGTGPVSFGDAVLVGTTSNPNTWSQRNATSQNAGATLFGVANTNAGSSALANIRLENDTDVGGIVSRNSSTNTAYAGTNSMNAGTVTNFPLGLITNNTLRLTVSGAGDVTANTGSVIIGTAGKGLQIKEGSNAKAGVSTLVGGTVTVSTTAVTANSRIQFSHQNASGTIGVPSKGTVVAGTSFVINSSSALDTSDIYWVIIEPSP